MSRTSSEISSVDYRINKTSGLLSSTIQAVLPAQKQYRYLNQQQIQALKTQGYYCKQVILNRNSKEEMQWLIQNLNFSRDINRESVFKGGTVVTHKCVGTESSKISTFDLQQTK